VKKLSASVSLSGETETITAMDFRKAPGEVLTQVSLGKTFVITKNGRPIAVVSRPELTALELGAALRAVERSVARAPEAQDGEGRDG